MCTGVWIWSKYFQNKRLIIHCDNMAVVGMLNKTSSSCQHCMVLLCLLVLRSMVFNFKIYAVYVNTKRNNLADSLSRLQFVHFWKLAGKNRNTIPTLLPQMLWPASKLWKFDFARMNEKGREALLKHDLC